MSSKDHTLPAKAVSPAVLVSRPLHLWIVLTAAVTWLLVGAGGLVTSHGVGMAVPDWPNTYGYNMFFFPFSRWVGGIFYEHTHRLIASTVGLMTAVMAVWSFGRQARPFVRWMGAGLIGLAIVTLALAPAHRSDAIVSAATGLAALLSSFVWPRSEPAARWLRILGVVAFGAVVLQGVLGGLRVILFKDQIGVFHATLAQLFFALLCSLAVVTSAWWANPPAQTARVTNPGLLRLFVAATGLILLQLILGATMRHQHAGLAIPDFPLAYGRLWPATDPASIAGYNLHRIEVFSENPITATQIVLQMVHRIVAIAILVSVAACAWVSRKAPGPIRNPAFAWAGLIILQVLLGAATIWSNKAADIATAHVMVGALSLAAGSIQCIVTIRYCVKHSQERINRTDPEPGVNSPFGTTPAPART